MTLLEGKQALALELDVDYSDIANNGLLTDADLLSWLIAGCLQAWDLKRWIFTEASKTVVLTSQMISDTYIDYPTDMQMGTINLLKINGKEYKKTSYQDYLKYLEDNPTGTKKIWAQYKRYIFFNTNVAAAGNILDAYGKGKFQQPTLDADLLPFSEDSDNQEYSGNYACILLAKANALSSNKFKNPNQAVLEEKKALTILEYLWAPFEQNEAQEQNTRPMLNVPDFFARGRGTSGSNNGNFNYDQ